MVADNIPIMTSTAKKVFRSLKLVINGNSSAAPLCSSLSYIFAGKNFQPSDYKIYLNDDLNIYNLPTSVFNNRRYLFGLCDWEKIIITDRSTASNQYYDYLFNNCTCKSITIPFEFIYKIKSYENDISTLFRNATKLTELDLQASSESYNYCTVSLDLSTTGMKSNTSLNNFFNTLPKITTVNSNYGTIKLPSSHSATTTTLAIATGKGWTVTS